METMNIFALKGHKVMVTEDTANNGYGKLSKKLKLNTPYKVERTEVGQSSTSVYLQEVEGSFNSVNFISITQQPSELNEAHPYYEMWHS